MTKNEGFGNRNHLYDWQENCLRAWQRNGCRGIVNVITGAGKTRVALEAFSLLRSRKDRVRCFVVVATLPLAKQWKQAIQDYFSDAEPVRIGEYHGKRKNHSDKDITIYVINSARQVLARHILEAMRLGYHIFLIADECHHYGSAENRRIFDFMKSGSYNERSYSSMGLSATPFTETNRKVLERALGEEIYHYSVDEALDDKVISEFVVFQIALSFSPEEAGDYDSYSRRMSILYRRLISSFPLLEEMTGQAFLRTIREMANAQGEDSEAYIYLSLAYKRRTLSVMAAARSKCAISLIQHIKNERILVFCERIAQAEALMRALQDHGIARTVMYHSKLEKEIRTAALEAFRDNRARILVACKALDEGMDVPDASVGIIVSSSMVTRQRIQRLGRLLRRSEGKKVARIYYLYIRESSDDTAYLAGQDGFPILHMRYLTAEESFIHETYEALAAKAYNEIAARYRLSAEQDRELRKCLEKGMIGADWLLEEEIIEREMEEAQGVEERNYWLVMKAIVTIRRGSGFLAREEDEDRTPKFS